MRTRIFRLLLLPAFLPLLLCCSSVSSRIDADRATFDACSPADRARIQAGDIAVGFTEAMVRMAKGEPSTREVLPEAGSLHTRWTYTQRRLAPMPGNPSTSDSAAAPYGYPSPDRPIQTQPSIYGELPMLVVEFENGKVIEWHVPR